LAVALRAEGIEIPGLEELVASVLFADDVAIVAESEEQLGRISEAWAERWEMLFGVKKCGIMVCEDQELRERVKGTAWHLQGQEVPIVSEYTYLGVTMQEDDGESMSVFQEKQVQRLRTLAGRLRPFLSSKSIPSLVRFRIFRSLVEPIARWGLELIGWSDLSGKLKTAYSQCVKALVGSSSKNTIYSIYCLSLELGVPLLEDLHFMARARAFYKLRSLKTFIAVLMANVGVPYRKLTWTTGVPRYLKTYPKLDLGKPWSEAKVNLGKYLLARREKEYDDRRSVTAWKQARYVNTVGFWKVAIFHSGVAKGVNWVVRARCAGIWTVKRAIEFGLVDATTVGGKCAACMVDLGETPELQHILLDCTKFEEARRVLEGVLGAIPETLPPDDRTRVLLRGSSITAVEGIRFSLGQKWSGANAEGIGEPKLPGFALLAKFCSLVWSWGGVFSE